MPRSDLLRYGLIFVLALLVLGAVAGRTLFRPSPNNHYSLMARGWLEGRTHLARRPPHRNDFARITILSLAGGRELSGHRCKTTSCRAIERHEQVETWRDLGGRLVKLRRSEIRDRTHRWYVSFPPGPAVVMLPLVAVWGLGVWDVLITAVAGALIPVILVAFFDRERGRGDGRGMQHLWAATAWTLTSPACFLATSGSVWFTAQIFGALFFAAFVASAWNLRAPAWAGLWLGLAIACRPPMAFALGLGLWEWWRKSGKTRPLVHLLAPLAVIGFLLAWFNWMRFDHPLEFGHSYLDIRWQHRMQEHGMFSLHYLGRNLHAMWLLLPRLTEHGLRWSVHGSSLLLSTPWLLTAMGARARFPQRGALWACVILIAVPALLYHNTGQLQFSYRFAADWLLLALTAIVMGGGAARKWFPPLVVLGGALGLYGAWMFAHAPGRLFVHSLWPYGEG